MMVNVYGAATVPFIILLWHAHHDHLFMTNGVMLLRQWIGHLFHN
jgi:hypothetical protein